MIFTDYLFVPAFLLTAGIYYLVPKTKQWMVLLAVSLLFYASWGFRGFVYLIGAVLISWGAALWIARGRERGKETVSPGRRRLPVLIAAAVLIGVLAAVKIRSFVPELGSILAPLGISYFTLSLVGYVVDVYWEIDEPERNPFRLLLFAAYFPKILEGPISRHRLTAPQLNEGHSFEYRRFCFGLQRMLWGYCEKLVIADRIAILTGTVLDNYAEYHGAVLLTAMILSAFELYCDFCGCMDIALGASEALGIPLEENFRRPFFSQTGAEFWRRWHITLGTWFRDYVFLPIGHSALIHRLSDKIRACVMKAGSPDAETAGRESLARRKRRSKRASRTVVTTIQTSCVWILTGLWHATGWNYVLWGIYWGVLIIVSSVLEPEIKRLTSFLHIPAESSGWKLFRQLRTFLLFVVGMIFCLPSTLEETAVIFRQILFHFNPWDLFDGTLLTLGLGWPNLILMTGMLIVLMMAERQQEKGVCLRDRIAQLPLIPRWCIYLGDIYFVLIFGVYGAGYDAASFVYMGF